MLAVRADAFTVGEISPHELVLVHDDRQLAINPQQHQQVRCGNKIGKVNLHGFLQLKEMVHSKQNRAGKSETDDALR
jgi:hypothetical protein